MKKVMYLNFWTVVFALVIFSCNSTKVNTDDANANNPQIDSSNGLGQEADGHTSENALDWEGVYNGTIPCADCEGIKTSITLNKENKYDRTISYIGKPDSMLRDTGSFTWDDSGSIITIGNGETSQSYKVGENILFHLDKTGNQIKGDLASKYRLMKNYSDSNLENKKWVLTELMGKPIQTPKDGKPAFVTFSSKEARMSGNNSCNLFSGSYSIKSGNRIEIGQMMNTMMACENMDQASQFMQVLQKADNYTVVEETMNLNKARMAPLAKFSLAKAD